MVDHALTDELREAEHCLQAAQLAGDVPALDRLLDDRLIYTGPPDGACYTKRDDLEIHRSRQLTFDEVVEEELTLVVQGHTGVTWALVALKGEWAGSPFATRVRYTRTWIYDDEHGWRVIAAHASEA